MPKLVFDFVAPEGTHFGVFQTPEERLLQMPSLIDLWNDNAESITQDSGYLSAWTGRKNGRIFAPQFASYRPTVTPEGICMFNPDTNAARGHMALSGANLGAMPQFTIATKVRLHSSALATDQQALWGASLTAARNLYRIVGGNNLMRLNVGAASYNVDADVPAGAVDIGVVTIFDGLTVTNHVAGGTFTTRTDMAAPLNIAAPFTLGRENSLNGAGTLAGWYLGAAMFSSALTGDDLAAALVWVS